MKVFIIGATGFLGYHATRIFLDRGHEVSTVSLPPMPSDDLLPTGVTCSLADINELTDDEISEMMDSPDAVVFAAGADERTVPKAPAWEFFKKHNVDSCNRIMRIAKDSGCKRAVVLNSYFAYFDRIWPKYGLAKHNPYIKSRVMQADEAIKIGGDAMAVMILELPYIFGYVPGRVPLWKDVLLDQFKERKSIPCFLGGTACVTARQVGEAIVGAVEQGEGGMKYPIGGVNINWDYLYRRLADLMGMEDKKLQMVPKWILKVAFRGITRKERAQGLESGADHVRMADIYCSETYIDPDIAHEKLGVMPDDFEAALVETVKACYPS